MNRIIVLMGILLFAFSGKDVKADGFIINGKVFDAKEGRVLLIRRDVKTLALSDTLAVADVELNPYGIAYFKYSNNKYIDKFNYLKEILNKYIRYYA
jgi:hypothetical protein